MRDLLWYASLVIEALLVGIVAQELPMLAVWLAFDVITGGISVWSHLEYPTGGVYQIPWELKQPGVIVTRVLAGRECWNRLGGRSWTNSSILISFLIYEAIARGWPHGVIEAEFAAVAITSATVAMILYRSLRAAQKLVTDPLIINHGYVLCGYFLLQALIYYVAFGYRDTIGVGTGLVAVLAYSTWFVLFVTQRRRERA
jgi:hypothetical protein